MRGIVNVCLAAVILLWASTIWGQVDIENQKGRDISQFLTYENFGDIKAVNFGPVAGEGVESAAAQMPHPDDIFWSPLGVGLGSIVYALTVYDGKMIAGGEFTQLGNSTPANRVAAWDGVSWSTLGLGIGNEIVEALTVYDNKLIAGGGFVSAGGIPVNYIAAWNGSSWSPLGTGMSGFVKALTVYDNQLIAGGSFATAGGVTVNYIAAWDGSSWSPLGSGVGGGVRAFTIYDNKLIVGGDFQTAGGNPANYVAAWDGSSWSPIGSGVNNYVTALTVYGNKLIAGGYFNTAGGNLAFHIAAWDGSSWSPLGSGMNDYVMALDVYENKLFAGGYFATAGGNTVNYIACWDGSSWSPLGSGMLNSVIAFTQYDGNLIAGGYFQLAGASSAARVAAWTKSPFLVVNSDNSGYGSFSDAIDSANARAGNNTIRFVISNMINLTQPLPVLIDDGTVILGSTAPGGAHSVILDGSVFSKSTNAGIKIQSSYNIIEGLTIRNFEGNGIEITGSAQQNTVSNNIIYANGLLGLDLGDDGVTLNDAGDIDTGPNDLLNYPEIDSLFMNPDYSYRVYGTAADSGIIEFFVAHPEGDTSKPADPSGHGEACSYIGSDTADASGNFEYEISSAVPYFSIITATCTDTLGNTSEFAPNFNLVPTPLIIVGYSPINLHIIDPAGDSIGKYPNDDYYNTIGSNATYDDIIHDSITIQYPLEGEYIIIIYPQGDPPPGSLYSIGIRIDGSVQAIIVENADIPATGTADTLGYEVIERYHYANGDASRDDVVNLLDILYLIAYLYNSPPGPAPYPPGAGDANCDLAINLIDILYLIANKYNTPPGPAPCQLQ